MNTFLPSLCAVVLLALPTASHADVIELASQNPTNGGLFGGSCSGIPDVNGDFVGDFIVGAFQETVSGQVQAGRVYVYSGKDWSLIRTHVSLTPEFQGIFGFGVAGIGDINNDARGDYIVGAWNEDGGGFVDSGRVSVYSGATGATIRTHSMPNTFNGAHFGYAVDAVPDLTGDGRPDYIIGSTGLNTNSNGKAFIYDGVTGNLVRTVEPPVEADASFGRSVAGVPDVNGDGRGDYAVGAPYADPGSSPTDAGRVFLFNGATGALLFVYSSPNAEIGGLFGQSIAGIKDVGGNNLGDVLIGAPFETVGQEDFAGRAYIFSGTLGLLNQSLESPAPEFDGQFGYSLVGVGDRNADGFEDVLIGAPGDGGGSASRPGRAYVMAGLNGGLLATLQSNYATSGDREFGYDVGAVPDVNEDDLPDFIIGADEDEGASGVANAGRAYLVRDLTNDLCGGLVGYLPLVDGFTNVTTIGATGAGVGLSCDGSLFTNDIWFTYEAPCDGLVSMNLCFGANFDSLIAVYEGCEFAGPDFLCDTGTLVACDDDGCGTSGGGSKLSFVAAAGDCFRVRIGGYTGAQGTGILLIDCTPYCMGDIDQSGAVNATDLSILLGAWGSSSSVADLDDDGSVGAPDLAILLGNWGPC